MPSSKNLIQSLRSAHDPHFKLEGRVGGLEKGLAIQVAQLHKTLSKSFAMQRKTLIRVLGLEERVAELERQKEVFDAAHATPEEVEEYNSSVPMTAGEKEFVGEESKFDAVDKSVATKKRPATPVGKKIPQRKRFRIKKKKISGADLKKGSSQESTENIGNKVSTNEKKITLLKNIIKASKIDIGEKLKSLTPEGQQGSLKDILTSIAGTVDSIRESLIGRQEFDEEQEEDARIKQEKEDRLKQEKDAEKEKFQGLKKIGDKVIAPVKSLWEKIFGFITTIFFGKILMGLLDWVTDKDNQKKIGSFVKFIGTWWPALVAAVLLFGTGFGGLVAGLLGAALAALPAIKAAGVALLTFIRMNPAVAALSALALAGTAFVASKVMGGEEKKDDNTNKNKKEDLPIEAGTKGKDFNEGGFVSGPEGRDRVPAKLTAGEFVMTKGAVEKYGVDTLAGMNAAAGGTNRPRGGRYNTGGEVNARFDMNTGKGFINEKEVPMDEYMKFQNMSSKEKLMQYGTEILGQDPNKSILPENENPSMKGSDEGGGGSSPMKVGDKSGENMEKNLEKEKQENKEKAVPIYNSRGRIIGYKKVKEVELSKDQKTKSADGISKPVSKAKNAVMAYNAAKDEGVNAASNAGLGGGGGNEVPSFEAGLMRDPSKIRTLGIMIL